MSRVTIERDLFSLLPSMPSGLPSDLVQLAINLVSQSRSVASTLRQEEEIARSYACCHIACERLKTRLDLPDIKPKPPCPPKAYRKVFEYLTNQLANSRTPSKRTHNQISSTQNTPSKRAAPNSATPTPHKAQKQQQSTTPSATPRSNRIAVAKESSSTQNFNSSFQSTLVNGPTGDIPDWLMSFIRASCKAISKPVLSPHIYAGCATLYSQNTASSLSIHRESARAKGLSGGILEDQLPALATTLVLLVTDNSTAEDADEEDDEMDVDGNVQRTEIFDDLIDQAITVLTQTTPLELSVKQFSQQVSIFQSRANEESWKDLEFFINLRQVLTTNGHISNGIGERDDVASEGSTDGDDQFNQRAGGGEMALCSVDWLSEKRKREYEIWQKGIREQLKRHAKA